MSLKEQVHTLVDSLPDDSPLLVEIHETLRINRAIGEALEDVQKSRVYEPDDFLTKAQQR